MSTIAMIMLLVSIITVWGGLVLAVIHLRANPDETSGDLGNSEH